MATPVTAFGYEARLEERLAEIQADLAEMNREDESPLSLPELFLLRETIRSLELEHLSIWRHLNVGSDL